MCTKTSIPFLFTLLLFSFSRPAQAQISVGFRGGLMITNIDKSPLEQGEPAPEAIAGYQVAVPIEIALGSFFAVQPEIMVGSHGAQQKGTSTSTVLGVTSTSTFNFKYKISTLEVPLLAKVNLGSGNLKFNILAGPSVGFGLKGKFTDQSSFKSTLANGTVVLDQNNDKSYNAKFLKEGYKSGDLSSDEFAVLKTNLNVHFGAGISLDLGGPKMFFDARYILGLTDLRPEADGDTKNLIYKSNRIGVSVGILIPL